MLVSSRKPVLILSLTTATSLLRVLRWRSLRFLFHGLVWVSSLLVSPLAVDLGNTSSEVSRFDDLLSARETGFLLPTLRHSRSRHHAFSIIGALDADDARMQAAPTFAARRKLFRYVLLHETSYRPPSAPRFADWAALERVRRSRYAAADRPARHHWATEQRRHYGDLNIAPRHLFRRGEYREVDLGSALVGSPDWKERVERDERRLEKLWTARRASPTAPIGSSGARARTKPPSPPSSSSTLMPDFRTTSNNIGPRNQEEADRTIAASLPLAVQIWGIGIFHKLHRRLVYQPDVQWLQVYSMFEHHNEADFVVLRLLFRKFAELFPDSICGTAAAGAAAAAAGQRQEALQGQLRTPQGQQPPQVEDEVEPQQPLPHATALMGGVAGGDFVQAAHDECPGASLHGFEVQPVFRDRARLRFASAKDRVTIHGVGWGPAAQEREVVGCGERATVVDVENGKGHFFLEAMAERRSAIYGYKRGAGASVHRNARGGRGDKAEVKGGTMGTGATKGVLGRANQGGAAIGASDASAGAPEGSETGRTGDGEHEDKTRSSKSGTGGGLGDDVSGLLVTDGVQVQVMRDEMLSDEELVRATNETELAAVDRTSIGRSSASFEIDFCTGRHLTLRQGRIQIKRIPAWCEETGLCGDVESDGGPNDIAPRAATASAGRGAAHPNRRGLLYLLVDIEDMTDGAIAGLQLEKPANRKLFPLFQFEHTNPLLNSTETRTRFFQTLEDFGYDLFLIGLSGYFKVDALFFSIRNGLRAATYTHNFDGNVLLMHHEFAHPKIRAFVYRSAALIAVRVWGLLDVLRANFTDFEDPHNTRFCCAEPADYCCFVKGRGADLWAQPWSSEMEAAAGFRRKPLNEAEMRGVRWRDGLGRMRYNHTAGLTPNLHDRLMVPHWDFW